MSCFPCFSSSKKIKSDEKLPVAQATEARAALLPSASPGHEKQTPSNQVKNKEDSTSEVGNIAAQTFTFRELATATKNFRQECLLGDGGFGRVYKGTIQSSGQIVAVKQLDRNGMQGNKEFLVEVLMLSLLKHHNLLNLIGYCADGDQRLLVYEYMPLGSLETHLHDNPADKKPLDWVTRMKIASGAAQGLEYLHEKANPPVIYRDLKSSNILLEEDFHPRLADFGLAKLSQSGNKSSVPPRVIGTYGYCAPEYARTGELTLKSDIYSFGVVLLELITGRRAVDPNRPADQQNLVTWAQPIFKDPKRYPEMADPLLNREFSVKSLNQAVAVAAMCLEGEPTVRPFITDVVEALGFLELDPKDVTNISTSNPQAPTLAEPSHIEIPNDSHDNKEVDEIFDHQSEDSSSNHEEEEDGRIENHHSDREEDQVDHEDRNDDDNLLDEDGGEDDEDEDEDDDNDNDDEVPPESHTKSIKSRSKKTKVDLSDDESMYSSSSRSSSSSINDK